MKKNILLILIGFISIACNRTGKNYFTDFPSVYNPEGKRIEMEIPVRSGTLHLIDSLLIVTNTFDSKKNIHLFNRTNYKYISSSAVIGKGPGEITNPFLATLDKSKRVIWCMDHGKRKIIRFPIDSILFDPNYIPSYSVPVPPEKRLLIQYMPYDNKLFSFLNNKPNLHSKSKALISFFDHNGNILDSLNIASNYGGYEDSWKLQNSNKIFYKYNFHPSKDKIVVVFRFSDIINILDNNGNILSSIQGPDKMNGNPLAPLTEAVLAYFDVCSDNKYIYCLYQGGERTKNENGMIISNYPHSLFIFDWDGIPIARINFEHSVTSFVIDQLNQCIITFSPDFGDFVIYELPQL
jgi:hypothetical protein